MKKIPVFASILLIAGVLATMAFSHPLAVRNGVVTSYTANGSLSIRSQGMQQDYMLPKNLTILPQNAGTQLGTGARVTVFAECFHGGVFNRNASEKASSNNGNSITANQHACIALAVVVRGPAAGAVPATGGTGGAAASGTTTPAAGTSTPATSTTAGTATPMVCPNPMMGTATPAAGTTGTATATVFPCVTATPTP